MKLPKLNKRSKVLVVASAVLIASSIAGAISNSNKTEAELTPPIQIQVNENEKTLNETKERVDILEVKQEATTKQVDELQLATTNNSQAIEQTKQEISVSIERTEQPPVAAPVITADPTPEPVNKYKVVLTEESSEPSDRYADRTHYTCIHTMEDGARLYMKTTLKTTTSPTCSFAPGSVMSPEQYISFIILGDQ